MTESQSNGGDAVTTRLFAAIKRPISSAEEAFGKLLVLTRHAVYGSHPETRRDTNLRAAAAKRLLRDRFAQLATDE